MQRFMHEQVYRDPADVEWLKERHLKEFDIPAFESFTLAGGKDEPARLDLYTSRRPEYNEHPVLVLNRGDDGTLDGPRKMVSKAPAKVIRRSVPVKSISRGRK